MILAAAHVASPFKLDPIALTLLGVALLPWLGVLLRSLRLPEGISSLELPWGIKITGADIGTQRRRREEEIRELSEGESSPEAFVERPSPPGSKPAVDAPALATAHLVAEELAFRKVEAELRVTIRRQRRLQPFKEGVVVDGFFVRDGVPTIVEVKYLTRPFVSRQTFARLFLDISEVKAHGGALRRVDSLELLVVAVADVAADDRERLEHSLARALEEAPCPRTLRVFGFQELRREFGVSEGA